MVVAAPQKNPPQNITVMALPQKQPSQKITVVCLNRNTPSPSFIGDHRSVTPRQNLQCEELDEELDEEEHGEDYSEEDDQVRAKIVVVLISTLAGMQYFNNI